MIRVTTHCLVFSIFIVLLFSCSPKEVTSLQQWQNAPTESWRLIPLEERAYCSDSSDYFIFSQKAASDHLLIHFSGGGACWNDETCSRPLNLWTGLKLGIGHELTGYYLPTASKNTPIYIGGLLSHKEKNPLHDWNKIYLPYCTGDLHLGNSERMYVDEKGDSTQFYHNGSNNIAAALAWILKMHPNPKKILLTGDSAGGYAAMLYTAIIAKYYPDAKIYQLVDCSYALVNGWSELATQWEAPLATQYEAFDTFLDGVYLGDEELKERVTFMQISSIYDYVLPQFRAKIENNDADRIETIQQWSAEMLATTRHFDNAPIDYRFFLTNHKYSDKKQDTPHTFINFDGQFFKCEQDGTTLSGWIRDNIVAEENYNVGKHFLVENTNPHNKKHKISPNVTEY
ncbi:MAG: pectin acetylesterase-family hydrolase [Bacteroidota bacterium]